PVSAANAEAIEAWDGPLFDRFVKYRHIVVAGLKQFGDEAMRVFAPPRGGRVLDIGCGFGDATQQLAELVGPGGLAVGVDAAPRFIEAARGGRAGGARQRAVRGHGCREQLVRRALRLRVLAHGHDVLRQPRGGAA
ncbi:MAG: hypothetical protein DLM61_25590, partial [Pseudonocardiales bacterium]